MLAKRIGQIMKNHTALQPLFRVGLLLLILLSGCKKENSRLLPSITIKVSEITPNSITMAGSITNYGDTILNKGVCWSTNQNPTIADHKTNNNSDPDNFTSLITGLTPTTTYYVRAYATNSTGTGYSSQYIVKTLALSPTLTTWSVTDVTDTKATAGGNISSDGGAPVTERGVCWSTSQNPTVNDLKTLDGTGTGYFNSIVTGLISNTTYYLRAYATNSTGTSYGNQVSFTTQVFSDGSCVSLKKATIGKGIDLVFFGDGYTAQDISAGKYATNINQAVNYFFAIEPYKTYSAYFNVYMVYAISAESGISTSTTTVNTKFSTKYTKTGSSEMTINQTACRNYTLKAPITDINNTVAIVIANSTQYGGTTYIHSGSGGLNISICPISSGYFRGILQHEAGGHGFGNLADEYVENDTQIPQSEIDQLRSDQSYGIFLNVDVTNNLSNILWKQFIGLTKYSYVSAFEGADLYSKGVWRPESGSLMINNINYINAPGREIIVKRIMKLAGLTYSFADFQSKDVMELTTKSASLTIDKSLILPHPVVIR
jgi:hypothetical protein